MEEVPRHTSLAPLASPLSCTLVNGVETEDLLDYQGRAGIMSTARWNLRLVIFGVERSVEKSRKFLLICFQQVLNVGGRKAPLSRNAAFSMLHCSFSLAAAQLLVKMTFALQKSQCCSATSAVQHSENCSASSAFACSMLQGWGL